MTPTRTLQVLVIAVPFIFVLWLLWTYLFKPAPVIQSYEECLVAEGSRLLESYPQQCVTSSGQTFTQPMDEPTKD